MTRLATGECELLVRPSMLLLISSLLMGCVTGGGGSVGLYSDTRGDVGIALSGHTNLLGFRVVDTGDSLPMGFPVFGIEAGGGLSLTRDLWHMRAAIPVAAATIDDIDDSYGLAVTPMVVVDSTWRYDGSILDTAWGGGLGAAWMPHLAVESEQYDGPDAFRIHRLGPAASVTLSSDSAGWFASFFLGLRYDFEAYVSSGR